MPTITALTSQKRPGYYNVFLDGEFWCGLTELQIASLDLRKNKVLPDEAADRLKELSQSTKAYHAALRYLSYRMRSQREMRQHLERKGHTDFVDEVIDRLFAEKYLDDDDFASRWVAMRKEEGKSPRAISAELTKKGIPREAIETALAEYDPTDRVDALTRIISKKRSMGQPVEKITQALQRQGWHYGDIKSALENEE